MSVRFNKEPFEVIVCGAGHAGIEAGLVAARMGCRVLVLSGNIDTVGQMSCNPAIGGVAKGHIVREIDALGGEMAINADVTGIQFRMLNASKGPAVQSPRAQCDKKAYQFRMKHTLELQSGLQLFQATVTYLLVQGDCVVGCGTNLDIEFYGKTIILTTGTFLRGLMHIGGNKTEGGRMGDFSAKSLSESLTTVGVVLERLKTGTPPRLLGRSIDFSKLTEQRGDEDPCFFAFHDTRRDADLFHVEQRDQVRLGWHPGERQVSCWITHTSEESEGIIRENLHRSAMYSGEIQGVGPRYCPSIEDKIVRFADKDRHMLFLEPEGRHTNEYYVNGLSTSLPIDIQQRLVHSIPGLEHAVIVRPAYAVEYDFAPPTQLQPTLESKVVGGLFFAGQINGTSGYEEAAGQGLLAGINAALRVRGEPPVLLGRHESYIGVMVDDLVTKGTREPYRMFTSRAEFRLLLNHGSAELRLMHHAERAGSVDAGRLTRIREKGHRVSYWTSWLENTNMAGGSFADGYRRSGEGALPLSFLPETRAIKDEVLYRIAYRGYLDRERRQAAKLIDAECVKIPAGLDYLSIPGLRKESALKLSAVRPLTVGQAGRISGVNPSDVSLLLIHVGRRNPSTAG